MSDMSMYERTDEGQIPEWTFADRLRKARESAGLDQAHLAELLAKKRSTLSNWERGSNRPDELAIRAIAHYTGVPFNWLMFGVSNPDDGGDQGVHTSRCTEHSPRPGYAQVLQLVPMAA